MKIDFERLISADQIAGEDETETRQLRAMMKDAVAFLSSFSWCTNVEEVLFGFGVGGIVGVFLARILPSTKEIDSTLWVVVGDLPSAYLVIDESPTPKTALRTYVREMRRWVVAAKSGASVEDCIPVNVEPTPENAAMLEGRLKFIQEELL